MPSSPAISGVFNAWGNTPVEGKLQILLLIFALEFASESKKPHYMRVRRHTPPPVSTMLWVRGVRG